MKRSDRIFWGIYILWVFTNLTICLFWGNISGHLFLGYGYSHINTIKYFFPFKEYYEWNYRIIHLGVQVYDYTELIFYCLLPIVIFFSIRLLFPQKLESDFNENKCVKTHKRFVPQSEGLEGKTNQ